MMTQQSSPAQKHSAPSNGSCQDRVDAPEEKLHRENSNGTQEVPSWPSGQRWCRPLQSPNKRVRLQRRTGLEFSMEMSFMGTLDSENTAGSSADRVIRNWQFSTASSFFFLFLSLFLQLLLGFFHVFKLFLDSWTITLTRNTKCLKEGSVYFETKEYTNQTAATTSNSSNTQKITLATKGQ